MRTGSCSTAQRFGGPQDDGGSGIAYDRYGNLILAGIFQGTITIEGSTLTGKDPDNLFIAKFSRDADSCVAGFADHSLDWGRRRRTDLLAVTSKTIPG